MKKKKIVIPQSYLKQIPVRPQAVAWSTDDAGGVTLKIENTGVVNRIAQTLFGRPRISYIHLDKVGSFVWRMIDGEKDITELGKLVDAEFGEEAHPLYERLARYFQILDGYRFVEWVEHN